MIVNRFLLSLSMLFLSEFLVAVDNSAAFEQWKNDKVKIIESLKEQVRLLEEQIKQSENKSDINEETTHFIIQNARRECEMLEQNVILASEWSEDMRENTCAHLVILDQQATAAKTNAYKAENQLREKWNYTFETPEQLALHRRQLIINLLQATFEVREIQRQYMLRGHFTNRLHHFFALENIITKLSRAETSLEEIKRECTILQGN